jgi:hypothetical protein
MFGNLSFIHIVLLVAATTLLIQTCDGRNLKSLRKTRSADDYDDLDETDNYSDEEEEEEDFLELSETPDKPQGEDDSSHKFPLSGHHQVSVDHADHDHHNHAPSSSMEESHIPENNPKMSHVDEEIDRHQHHHHSHNSQGSNDISAESSDLNRKHSASVVKKTSSNSDGDNLLNSGAEFETEGRDSKIDADATFHSVAGAALVLVMIGIAIVVMFVLNNLRKKLYNPLSPA